jgi:hypothetical protein
LEFATREVTEPKVKELEKKIHEKGYVPLDQESAVISPLSRYEGRHNRIEEYRKQIKGNEHVAEHVGTMKQFSDWQDGETKKDIEALRNKAKAAIHHARRQGNWDGLDMEEHFLKPIRDSDALISYGADQDQIQKLVEVKMEPKGSIRRIGHKWARAMTTDYRLSHHLPLGELDGSYSDKSWGRVDTPKKAHEHAERLAKEYSAALEGLRQNPTIGQIEYYKTLIMDDLSGVNVLHRGHKDSPLALRVKSKYEPASGDEDIVTADDLYHDPIPYLDRPNEFENLRAAAYERGQAEAQRVRVGWKGQDAE